MFNKINKLMNYFFNIYFKLININYSKIFYIKYNHSVLNQTHDIKNNISARYQLNHIYDSNPIPSTAKFIFFSIYKPFFIKKNSHF